MKELVREDDLLKVLEKLPKQVFIGPTDAAKLAIRTGYLIKRGMSGYIPLPSLTDETATRMNTEAQVTPTQIEAMQVGSMFGWDAPGADPDNCTGFE